MAKGEQVYAARFLGDVAYFVTYRNTDPLLVRMVKINRIFAHINLGIVV